ncbi:MAG: outer membrane beta-barrel protein [Terriglobia bacterium]
MKKPVLISLAALFFSTPTLAQESYPRVEVAGGYSLLVVDRARRNMPKGWTAGVAVNFHRNFGIETNFAGHYGHLTVPLADESYYLFQGGPRVTLRLKRLTPWAHALFGVSQSRIAGASVTKTDFAESFGGGLDVNIHKRVALRVVQADYVRMQINDVSLGGTGFGLLAGPTPANNLSLSFGFVLKLGGG